MSVYSGNTGDLLVEELRSVLTPDWEDLLRSVAVMFEEVESYVLDPDEDGSPFYLRRRNWCPNPGFEYDQIGLLAASWSTPVVTGTATTVFDFAVSPAWASHGSQSAFLSADGMTPRSIITTDHDRVPAQPGQLWAAEVDFDILTGSTEAGLGIRFYDSGGAVIETVFVWAIPGGTVDGGTAVDGGTSSSSGSGVNDGGSASALPSLVLDGGTASSSVGFLTSGRIKTGVVIAPAGTASVSAIPAGQNTSTSVQEIIVRFDSFMLQDGGPCDAYFDGSFDGYLWDGVPGASSSQPCPEIPEVGWSKMFDVDRADYKGLPYLAQWVGERLPADIDDVSARTWIKRAPNQDRGTVSAVAYGAMNYLTGTQTVLTRERYRNDGTADTNTISVMTYGPETPNVGQLREVIYRKLMPAGLLLDLQQLDSVTWADIETGSPTWATIESGSPTWRQIEQVHAGFTPTGYTLWTP